MVTLTEKAAKHINRYIERRGKGVGLRWRAHHRLLGPGLQAEYVDEAAAEDRSSNRTA
jgi:iron-sulfur cluster assembly protein